MYKPALKIITMVEEGKITIDEAVQLLEALKGVSCRGEFRSCAEEKIQAFSEGLCAVADEVKYNATNLYNNVKPKIKVAAKKMADKTSKWAEDVSKTFNNETAEQES